MSTLLDSLGLVAREDDLSEVGRLTAAGGARIAIGLDRRAGEVDRQFRAITFSSSVFPDMRGWDTLTATMDFGSGTPVFAGKVNAKHEPPISADEWWCLVRNWIEKTAGPLWMKEGPHEHRWSLGATLEGGVVENYPAVCIRCGMRGSRRALDLDPFAGIDTRGFDGKPVT